MSFKKIIFIKCILFLNISLAYAEFEIVEKNANIIESSKINSDGTESLFKNNGSVSTGNSKTKNNTKSVPKNEKSKLDNSLNNQNRITDNMLGILPNGTYKYKNLEDSIIELFPSADPKLDTKSKTKKNEDDIEEEYPEYDDEETIAYKNKLKSEDARIQGEKERYKILVENNYVDYNKIKVKNEPITFIDYKYNDTQVNNTNSVQKFNKDKSNEILKKSISQFNYNFLYLILSLITLSFVFFFIKKKIKEFFANRKKQRIILNNQIHKKDVSNLNNNKKEANSDVRK